MRRAGRVLLWIWEVLGEGQVRRAAPVGHWEGAGRVQGWHQKVTGSSTWLRQQPVLVRSTQAGLSLQHSRRLYAYMVRSCAYPDWCGPC